MYLSTNTKLSLITADYLDTFSLPPAHVADTETLTVSKICKFTWNKENQIKAMFTHHFLTWFWTHSIAEDRRILY